MKDNQFFFLEVWVVSGWVGILGEFSCFNLIYLFLMRSGF